MPPPIEAALATLTGDLTGAAGELSGAVAALDGIPPAAAPLQAVKVLRGLLLQTRDVVADGGALVDTLRSFLLLAEELRVTFSRVDAADRFQRLRRPPGRPTSAPRRARDGTGQDEAAPAAVRGRCLRDA